MNPLKKNHFELFGIAERYELDAAGLDSAYRSVQGAIHPDRFAGATDAERRMAMQLAAQANEAYRTLRDPSRRAAYLCELHGADPQAQSNTAMAPEFLMQQMEWRERLEEARGRRDVARIEELRGEVSERRMALRAALADALDAQRDFPQAAGLVRQLMFVDRFAEEIDDAEESLLQA